jgi:mannitol/fructose-specific phosphotransferase system IIA component (Ntr-type)
MVLLGGRSREKHLRILSGLSNLLNSQSVLKITAAKSAQEIYDILCGF